LPSQPNINKPKTKINNAEQYKKSLPQNKVSQKRQRSLSSIASIRTFEEENSAIESERKNEQGSDPKKNKIHLKEDTNLSRYYIPKYQT